MNHIGSISMTIEDITAEHPPMRLVLQLMDRSTEAFHRDIAVAWRSATPGQVMKLQAAFGDIYDIYSAMVRDRQLAMREALTAGSSRLVMESMRYGIGRLMAVEVTERLVPGAGFRDERK